MGAQYNSLGWGCATLGEAGVQGTGGKISHEQDRNIFHLDRKGKGRMYMNTGKL